jgi:VanZ family protein
MGRGELRVIRVPKVVTAGLLLLTSAGMLGIFYLLSRHAYVRPTGSTADLLRHAMAAEEAGRLTPTALIASLWPVAANLGLFLPWGFLMFVVLDRPQRSRSITYAIVITGGILFASAIQVWNMSLPSRVTTTADAVANGVGTLCGAILGHLRKQVRIRFDY